MHRLRAGLQTEFSNAFTDEPDAGAPLCRREVLAVRCGVPALTRGASRWMQFQALPVTTSLAPRLFCHCRGPFFKQAWKGEQWI